MPPMPSVPSIPMVPNLLVLPTHLPLSHLAGHLQAASFRGLAVPSLLIRWNPHQPGNSSPQVAKPPMPSVPSIPMVPNRLALPAHSPLSYLSGHLRLRAVSFRGPVAPYLPVPLWHALLPWALSRHLLH